MGLKHCPEKFFGPQHVSAVDEGGERNVSDSGRGDVASCQLGGGRQIGSDTLVALKNGLVASKLSPLWRFKGSMSSGGQ